MPEVECSGYLIGYLFEMGPTLAAGMGGAVISQGEIESWQNNTGIRLRPWEVRWLRRLSGEYLSEQSRASDPLRPAPWPEGQVEYQAVHTAQMKAAMRRLAADN